MQALWTCPKLRVGVAGEEPMGPGGLVHPAGRLLAQPHSTCSVRQEFLFFSLKKKLFIYFCLCSVFTATPGLSLVAASKGFSSLSCAGFSLRWLPLWSMGSRAQAQ